MVYNLFGSGSGILSSDYKSAGSHQVEVLQFELVTDTGVWEEIYVVPADKTLYISSITLGSRTGGVNMIMGTGAAASEAKFLVVSMGLNYEMGAFAIPLVTPIKFAGGTRIACKTDSNDDCFFTFVGWIE